MKIRNKVKHILSAALSTVMLLGSMPTLTFAAQVNEYVDPADIWVSANGRTNELDFNATITQETGWCPVCNKDTIMLTYRTPEYTKSGTTALNRGVKYSDGTMVDGQTTGNLDNGTPNQDATYTTYHWTKSVCQACGTINSIDGENDYAFSRNVYGLNSCDHNFFLDFDNTTYEPYSSTKHTTTLKRGKYCQFCKGTQARATQSLENHHFTETIDAQLGNNRFFVSEHCEDCGYETSEYITAKSVVSSYYGTADEEAHTVTVSDLSDSSVHTSIRYGTSAGKCNLTSAPNYTEAGYYPVYYEIDYKYDGKNMTENGVSYVWLLEKEGDTIIVIPPVNTEEKHTHDFRYLETVAPSCDNLGYERWQCDGCGSLEKRNYTPATGHDYENITIREATCKQGGLLLSLCKNCGDFHQTTTPTGEHKYKAEKHNPTCRMTGYTEYVCEVCGDSYMNDITPIISHSFERITKKPTCTDKGYTTSTCTMCGLNYVSDYTEPTGHTWDEGHAVTSSACEAEGVTEFHCLNCDEKMIKAESATGHTPGAAATCTEPQTCEKCGTVLELPKGHTYSETVIAPTCTAMGYSVFECKDCGDSYTGNFTDKAEHHYHTTVTEPTCTAMGFTDYECTACGNTFTADYTDKLPHDYKAEITNPTCTEFGYTTFTCSVCGESYTADYTDKLPHNYNKQTIPPTCTEHGYTIYQCPDCGNEYIGDFTECREHHYAETVTVPTCTELGYTTYVCEDCGETHKGNYIEATGHKPSDWIVDVPATIEGAGSKHIECTVCGEALKTVEIPQLTDKDNSDEDGNSKVGDYSILITDKNNKPVFDSEISIDKNDNITIKLPDGRLLSAEDITTITVTDSRTQQPATDINIFIADTSNNAATGKTDVNGQLKVPNTQSSTGDSNGTVTDSEKTYVVIATNKSGELIPNCNVTVGDNYSIDVKLPDGTAFDKDNRITVTVVTEKGEPVNGLRVQLIGDSDYIENGYTNIKGQLTLPMSNTDITDDKGNGEVGDIKDDKIYDYIVTVSDENGLVKDALITLVTDDNAILVCLPDEKVIDYYNRTTIKVTKADGTAVADWKVSVYNKDGSGIRTEITDEDGIVIVPPLSEAPISKPTPAPNPGEQEKPLPGVTPKPDNTGEPSNPTDKPTPSDKPSEPTPTPDMGDGAVVQTKEYKYRVYVWDNDGVFADFGLIKLLDSGNLEIKLPESKTLMTDNRVNVKVLNEEKSEPVKGIAVNVSDSTGASASDITNSAGIAVVPPTNTDMTDNSGYAQVIENDNVYNIVVEDTKAKIENAYVEIKDGKISVLLPDGNKLDTANQTTVTVTDKNNKAAANISVTVTDKDNKTATKSTDANGKITVPIKSSGGSSGGGSSRPSGGGGGGGYVKPSYTVKVVDKDGKTVNVNKTIKDDKITLTLPNGKTLDDNYYTITVTDNKGKVTADIDVTLKDKTNSVSGITDANGQLIMPTNTHNSYVVGYEDGAFKPDGNMTRAEAAAIFARLVSEKKGEKINSAKTSFADISKNEWYSGYVTYLEKYGIIKGYSDNTFRPDEAVTRAEFVSMTVRYYGLFDKVSYPANTTKYSDIDGKHWAVKDISFAKNIGWLNGYADGTFRPDNNITRAEVVTVVNHATGRYADKEYINSNLSVLNKFTDLKNNSHWGYYEIMEAANTHKAVTNSDSETWVK